MTWSPTHAPRTPIVTPFSPSKTSSENRWRKTHRVRSVCMTVQYKIKCYETDERHDKRQKVHENAYVYQEEILFLLWDGKTHVRGTVSAVTKSLHHLHRLKRERKGAIQYFKCVLHSVAYKFFYRIQFIAGTSSCFKAEHARRHTA